MAAVRRDIIPVLTDDDLVLWLFRGQSDRLVLCFSGIGKRADAPPTYEFAEIATGGGEDSVLYISDPRRSWLNADGLIEKIAHHVDRIRSELGAHRLVTLGHSMGGFSAMALAAKLGAQSAVAFAPQVSVHPDIVGDDHRWMEWRAQIKTFRVRSVDEMLADGPTYHVFHGLHGREAPQRDRVPFRDNLIHTILPRTHHNVSTRLKNAGLLADVVASGFDNKRRRLRQMLKPLNGFHRVADNGVMLPPSAQIEQVEAS